MASGTNRQRVESLVGKSVAVTYRDNTEIKSHTGMLRGVDGRLAEFDKKRIWIPNITDIKPAW